MTRHVSLKLVETMHNSLDVLFPMLSEHGSIFCQVPILASQFCCSPTV